jgi:hypothetical protein
MKRLAPFFIALILGASIIWFWERAATGQLRRSHESLLAQRKEAEQWATANQELAALESDLATNPAPEVPKLELLRLRNEARQLREQLPEVEALRSENQRLAQPLETNAAAEPLPSEDPFVTKETWANAGTATPDSTVNTYLSGLRDSNFDQIIQCLSPDGATQTRESMENDPRARERFLKLFQFVRDAAGYRAVNRDDHGNDQVTLRLQMADRSEVLNLGLRRYGVDWKIESISLPPSSQPRQ